MPLPGVRRGLGPLDGVLILCIAAVMCWLCVLRSREHLLWADELLGYQVFSSRTLAGVMRGWWFGADGGGPLYYLLGDAWMRLFGLSALSLRLFSTAGMVAALVLVWMTLRRFFDFVPTASAASLVFLLPSAVRWQEVNGRFYGLFLASAAFAGLCFVWTASTDRLPKRLLVLTAVAQACLLGSHILGLVYSAALVVAMVAQDAWRHRLRWRLYGSALAGWVVLPVSLHAIRASTSIAKDNLFWTRRPLPSDVLLAVGLFHPVLLHILVCSMAASALFWSVGAWRGRHAGPGLAPEGVFLCGAFWLAMLLLFLKSETGLSVFSDRYLLPESIATAWIFAACFQLVLGQGKGRKPAVLALAGACVMLPCAGFALRHRDLNELYPRPGVPEAIASHVPRGMPVLVTQGPPFALLSTYDPGHQYFYLLDWAYDLRPHHPPQDLSGQRLLENWVKAGYRTDRIEPCHAVLLAHPELDVLIEPGREDWFQARFGGNPEYAVDKVATFSDWEPLALWHVRRVRPGPAPC